MQQYKIICVPDIVSNLERSFHELVERVHINIDEELACEVSERKTDISPPICTETGNDLLEQPQRVIVCDTATQDAHQDLMINVGEKLPDIALEHPSGSRIVAGDLARELPEPMHRAMRSLVFTTGVGIVDEERIEKGVELPVDRMVYQTVTHRCFMDMPRLWIIDAEGMVRSMAVRFLR